MDVDNNDRIKDEISKEMEYNIASLQQHEPLICNMKKRNEREK